MFEGIKKLIEKNDLEKALIEIRVLLMKAAADEDSLLRLIDVPEIDELLQLTGKRILQSQADFDFKKPINKNLNVYITEAVYRGGGHTREIEDWIENTYKDRENILIITGFFYGSHEDQLQKLKEKNIKVLLNYNADSKDRVGNIKWLQRQLWNLRPDAIFLSTTRFDLVSIAALQVELVNKLYLNLSMDNGISLGIHIKHLTNIIVKRPYLYFYIKDNLHLNNLIYVPLNRPDIFFANKSDNKLNKKIVTASCTSSIQKIEIEYIYKFIDVIPNIIKATGGRHIHIGAISENALKKLYKNMDLLGLERDLFTRITFVDRLAKSLIEKNVDIFIQTFPMGGGLAAIEAMQASIMVINHKHLYTYLSNNVDSCYKGSFAWKTPEELYDFLEKITPEEIVVQGKMARDHYLKYNDSKILEKLVAIDNFIGVDAALFEGMVRKEYSYDLNYFIKSLDTANKANSNNYKERRSLLYRLSKSFKKKLHKFIANYFSNENRVN